jgi:YHS domain-containing protein
MRVLFVALTLSLGVGVAFSEDAPKKEKDPKDMSGDELEAAGLCPVSRKLSKPVYHYDYKDKTYHFCSRDCQKSFAADPTKFVKAAPAAAGDKKDMKK